MSRRAVHSRPFFSSTGRGLAEDEDRRFMRLALASAREAGCDGEVPVGAVVALEGRLVASGRNRSVGTNDATAHAEVMALRAAGRVLDNYRLTGATLYCTVEPCIMCLGAALHARIARLVYGAADPKVGAVEALTHLRARGADFNHRFEAVGDVLAGEASALLAEFFGERREPSGEVPKWS